MCFFRRESPLVSVVQNIVLWLVRNLFEICVANFVTQPMHHSPEIYFYLMHRVVGTNCFTLKPARATISALRAQDDPDLQAQRAPTAGCRKV